MANSHSSNPQSADAVAEQLRRQATPDGQVDAQIFFEQTADPEALSAIARNIIREAERQLQRPDSVSIRKVHNRAASVSVHGDVDVITAIQNNARVKSVLPNEIPDILPRPVGKR